MTTPLPAALLPDPEGLNPDDVAALTGSGAPLTAAAQTFQIDNDRAAEWAGRVMAEADARLSARQVELEEFQEQLATWWSEVAGADLATVERMSTLLEGYALRTRDADEQALAEWEATPPSERGVKPKVRKMISTTTVKVTTTATPEKVTVANEEDVIAWVVESFEVDEIPEVCTMKPKVTEVRKHVVVTDDGQVIHVLERDPDSGDPVRIGSDVPGLVVSAAVTTAKATVR